jgi:very-short-patch-repair endonuclease
MQRPVNNTENKNIRRLLRRNQTIQETILWSKLRNNQTGFKWKRQVGVGSYIADFYCYQKNLVIEIDGAQHLDTASYDEERRIYFETLGIKTIRFGNNEINTNIHGVLIEIENELNSSTSPQPSPSQERE